MNFRIQGASALLLAFLLPLASVSQVSWANSPGVKTVLQVPHLALAPLGFDDNDNAQVVLSGVFPNTCFRVGPVTSQVDASHQRIIISNEAYFYPSSWCLQVFVPYTQTVNLGPVKAGNYDVVVKSREGDLISKGSLTVAVSTHTDPDDYLYAPVKDVSIEDSAQGKALVLKGTFDYDCFTFKEVKVQQTAPNVVVVLPILNEVNADTACKPQTSAFEKRVALPKGLQGSTLIHVRALNGQSLNPIIEF